MMQKNIASRKKEAMALLNKNTLLRIGNYKNKATLGIVRAWKRVTNISVRRAGPKLSKENCLRRAWARNGVTMKATCLQFAAHTRLELKRIIRLEVQLEQRIASESFLIVTNLATDMNLWTGYVDENSEKCSSQNGTLKPNVSIPVAIEEGVDSIAFPTSNAESKQRHSRNEFSEYPCTAVCQKIVPLMSEVYL